MYVLYNYTTFFNKMQYVCKIFIDKLTDFSYNSSAEVRYEKQCENKHKRENFKRKPAPFCQKGYGAVGVAEIADAVGIKAPSLYKHFTGKKRFLTRLSSV